MAMSSSSMTDSSESLNGLTIGHKIYFEDVGLGVTPKSGTGLSSTVSAQSKKLKAGSGSGLGGSGRQHLQQQPPRCLVEGCNVDLSDVKAYYSRHKVCIMHSKSAVVTVGGVLKRFCQQCSRFHQLSEFDQEKRSCRRRLAGHNERRRKPPPVSLLSSHYGSSLFDTNNQGRGFLLDFSRSSVIPDIQQRAKSSDRQSVLQTQGIGKFLMDPWSNSYETPPSGHSFHNAGGGTSFPCQEIPPGEYQSGGFSSDSSRALSLLSNVNRAASNQVVLDNSLMNPQNSTFTNLIPATSWGFNGNESAGTAHKMFSESDLGLGQIPQTGANLYPVEYGVGQQDGRQDLGAELSSRFYESVQQMHWSL